jgi:predicted Zn-dependent protease
MHASLLPVEVETDIGTALPTSTDVGQGLSMGFLEERRELARKANRNEDWQGALNIWEKLRTCLFDSAEIFVGRGDALQALGRLDEAEAAFAEAKKLFPKNEWAAARHAGVAEKRRDWAEAIRRWDEVANAFPYFSLGCIAKGDILQNLGNLDEAEEIFRAAMKAFPDDEWAAIRHAGISVQKRDWTEASRRWEFLRTRFPDQLIGALGQAEALRELGRFADAEAVLTEASERFPGNEWLTINLARIAMAAGAWDEALRRWETAMQRFSHNPMTHGGMAETLTELERFDAARAVLDQAANRFPQDAPWLYVGLGKALIEAGRLDEAEGLSADAVARFPNDPAVKTLRAQMVGEGSHPDQPSATETTISRSEVTASELMMNFESLGDNCEFGFVQRFHGAEPLGLLRFSTMPYDLLMSALENRFEGVGDPENTILEVDELHQEFMISDKRYNMAAHTFTYVTAIDRQKFFQQQCRRLTYLRRKLITDLENCEKILVFRSLEFLSDQQVWALFRRIKTYGPNTLLCVRPQIYSAGGDGRVKQLDDRLWIGYVKIIPSALMQMENIAHSSWLKVCRQVYASWSKKGTI